MPGQLIRETRVITSRGEWLHWREGLLTASSIGALFGVDPHVTIDELTRQAHGVRGNKIMTPAMRRGNILEPAVIAAVQEEHPEWSVEKANTFHVLPDQRLGATPDAFGVDQLLVQCKTVAPEQWERWNGSPPLHHTLQTQTELLVTGCEKGVLAVLVCSPAFPLFLFEVPAHPAAQAKILAAAEVFWRRIDAGEAPAVSPKDELEALLDDGSHVNLSGDNYLPEALDEREHLVAERGSYDRRIKYIDAEVKLRLGAASTAWLPGWAISWRAQHRKEFTTPAADIRVLRIKRTKEMDDEINN